MFVLFLISLTLLQALDGGVQATRLMTKTKKQKNSAEA